MSTAQLRKDIKQIVDRVPADRLTKLVEFAESLARPTLRERLAEAERAFKAGKSVSWRKVRRNVRRPAVARSP